MPDSRPSIATTNAGLVLTGLLNAVGAAAQHDGNDGHVEAGPTEHFVPLFPAAIDDDARQGFMSRAAVDPRQRAARPARMYPARADRYRRALRTVRRIIAFLLDPRSSRLFSIRLRRTNSAR